MRTGAIDPRSEVAQWTDLDDRDGFFPEEVSYLEKKRHLTEWVVHSGKCSRLATADSQMPTSRERGANRTRAADT